MQGRHGEYVGFSSPASCMYAYTVKYSIIVVHVHMLLSVGMKINVLKINLLMVCLLFTFHLLLLLLFTASGINCWCCARSALAVFVGFAVSVMQDFLFVLHYLLLLLCIIFCSSNERPVVAAQQRCGGSDSAVYFNRICCFCCAGLTYSYYIVFQDRLFL
jgi:hypothetical protein